MKNIFTLSLLLICGLCFGQNSPYFNHTSVWHWSGGSANFFQYDYYHHKQYVDGDTVVNGVSYFKIFRDKQDTIKNMFGQVTSIDSTRHLYEEALREDSGRVYRIYVGSHTEFQVYDYNLYLGQIFFIPDCQDSVIVSRIDIVSFAGSLRHIFTLDSSNYKQIIEGVGSHWGLSVLCPHSMGIEGGLYLDCYEMDGDRIGFTNQCPPLYTTVLETQNERVYISPNPFSNQLTFKLAANEPTTVSLYDFLGQQILQQTFTNSTTINTAQMQAGIYFYELSNAKGTLKTGKLVKE